MSCTQALVRRQFLMPSDFAQAELLPRNANLPKELFETYMEARLRQFSVALQVDLAHQIDVTEIVLNDEGVVQGEAFRNAIMVPNSLKDSVVVELIRVHELEHLIQISQRGFFKTVLKSKYSAKEVFENEEAAIRAEWEFLQLLPSYVIQNAIREIKAADLESEGKSLLLGMLTKAHLSREGYLESQHQAGRYRAIDVQRRTAENYMKILVLSIAGIDAIAKCTLIALHHFPF